MKKKMINKVLAVILSTVLVFSVASCSSNKESEETQETIEVQENGADSSAEKSIKLADATFEDLYGSQLETYLNHQYEYRGKEVPIEVTNFYYITAFSNLNASSRYYQGSLPLTAEGFVDLSAEVEKDGKIEGDVFRETTELALKKAFVELDMAKEAGITVQDDDSRIVEMMDEIEKEAEDNDVTLEEYFKIAFNIDEDTYKERLVDICLVQDYEKKYYEEYDFSNEEIPNSVECSYATFVPSSMLKKEEPTEEEINQNKEQANDLLKECTTSDDIQEKGMQLQNDGKCHQAGVSNITEDSEQAPKEMIDWCFEKGRKENDTTLIEDNNVCYVIGYKGTKPSEEAKQKIVYDALKKESSEYIAQNNIELETEEEFGKPEPVEVKNGNDENVSTENDSRGEKLVLLLAIFGGVVVAALIILLIISNMRRKKEKEETNIEETEN